VNGSLSVESHPCHPGEVTIDANGFSADIARSVVGITNRQLAYHAQLHQVLA
jgi:hypothetical protein